MRRAITSTIFVCFLASSLTVAQAQQESTRKLTSSRPPAYPALARGMNLEGNVKLRVPVSPGVWRSPAKCWAEMPCSPKPRAGCGSTRKWVPAPQETQVVVNLSFHPQPFILKHFLILQLLKTPVSRPSLTALWGIVIAITLARSSCHGCASVSW